MDIMSRIKSKTVTSAAGTAEGEHQILEGKTLEYTDWKDRSKRIRSMLIQNPADVILLQDVSRNKEYGPLTLDDIF